MAPPDAVKICSQTFLAGSFSCLLHLLFTSNFQLQKIWAEYWILVYLLYFLPTFGFTRVICKTKDAYEVNVVGGVNTHSESVRMNNDIRHLSHLGRFRTYITARLYQYGLHYEPLACYLRNEGSFRCYFFDQVITSPSSNAFIFLFWKNIDNYSLHFRWPKICNISINCR